MDRETKMDYDNVCTCVCIYVIAVIYICMCVCVYSQYDETDRTDTEQKKIPPEWIHRHSLLMQNKTFVYFQYEDLWSLCRRNPTKS